MKRLCCLLCCLSVILVVSCTPKKPAVIAVTGITIDQTKATLIEGETLKLIPTIMPADATDPSIRWTSSYPTVATVDETGLVTAIKSGSTAITATTNDGGYTAPRQAMLRTSPAGMRKSPARRTCPPAPLPA